MHVPTKMEIDLIEIACKSLDSTFREKMPEFLPPITQAEERHKYLQDADEIRKGVQFVYSANRQRKHKPGHRGMESTKAGITAFLLDLIATAEGTVTDIERLNDEVKRDYHRKLRNHWKAVSIACSMIVSAIVTNIGEFFHDDT